MRLLSEHVNDPNVPRREKLEVLQPYLTKLMPVLVEVTDTGKSKETGNTDNRGMSRGQEYTPSGASGTYRVKGL